jgi:4-amino-4-deoxy-L-arabinose transferase-like glycosyltransferase
MIDFLKKYQGIAIITLFAFVIRIAWIDFVPASLNWDEVSHGWNAYSILKTSKDEWGETFPFIFRAFGDYKLPLYIYLVAVTQSIFGLGTFAVRLPSILAGTGSVIFTYLLSREIFKEEKKSIIPILSSLLVAIEPWSLFISRGAFEANVAVFLIIAGFYFFLKGIEKNKHLVVAGFLLGLSIWTYNSARVFIPVMLFFSIVIFWKEIFTNFKKNRLTLLLAISIFFVFFVPMIWQMTLSSGQARYEKVAIIDAGAVSLIESKRVNSKLPAILSKLRYNRPVYFAEEFASNWFSHFSVSYLFTKGGSQYQFSVPGKGILFPIDLLAFYAGLLLVISKTVQSKKYRFLLLWILTAPIAASITREAPHVLRSSVILPLPMIVIAMFWDEAINRIKINKKAVKIGFFKSIYLLILLIMFLRYENIYFTSYRKEYSWSWQYGYREVVNMVRDRYNNYDAIIISKKYGEPHVFFLYFWPWNPQEFRDDKNLVRFFQSEWYWVDKYDKFYFVNDWLMKPLENTKSFKLESGGVINCSNIRCLVITSPGMIPDDWRKIDTIRFLDNKAAFELYEN